MLRGYVERSAAFTVFAVYVFAKRVHKEAGGIAVASCGDAVEGTFTISIGARHEANKALRNV